MIVDRAMLEASLARLRAGVRDPRGGIHGPGSASWQLGRDSALFLGGGRAVLLQLAHPFVAAAIAEHSKTRDEVLGRFQRTFDNIFAMTFGDLDAAFTAARRVHNIHTRIVGELRQAAGPFPAGTRYQANDVESLRWVWATLLDSVLVVQERLRGPLPTALADAYVRDGGDFARLFGIPDDALPGSFADFRAYVGGMLASDTLTVTPSARDMCGFLFGGPLGQLAASMAASMLPPRLREGFGLPYGPLERATATGVMIAARTLRRVLPRPLRDLPAYRDARRRMAGKGPSPFSRWLDTRLTLLAGRVSQRPLH